MCEKRKVNEYELDSSKYYGCKHVFEPKYGNYCTGVQQAQPCWFSHHPSLIFDSEHQTGSAAEMERVWGKEPDVQLWALAFAPIKSAVFRYVTDKTLRQVQPTYLAMLEECERLSE
jgi:hypothetical protein